jgi:hypothetical protein
VEFVSILREVKENFVSAIYGHSHFDMPATHVIDPYTVDTAYYVASGSISHFKYDMCLKASFNDMPGIRKLWAAL